MADYKVNSESLTMQTAELSAVSKRLSEVAVTLGCMELGSILCIKASTFLIGRINECTLATTKHALQVQKMQNTLQSIASLYNSTERNCASCRENGVIRRTSDGVRVDSNVFDDEGSYGGDQGSPKNSRGSERQELYAIIRKYYPNMTDEECRDYLRKLNSEGCGYVAVINTIFAAYELRAADFERDFGFPMYDESGDLNYNKLLVDMYSATDNHNKTLWWDTVSSGEDGSATEGSGTSPSSREYRADLYLSERGVDVSVSRGENVTVDNFHNYDNGYVIVSFHDGNLYNADGSVAQYIDGGHAMVITGVTADGRYVVSSWGQEYYLDPNNGSYNDFSYWQYN